MFLPQKLVKVKVFLGYSAKITKDIDWYLKKRQLITNGHDFNVSVNHDDYVAII